MTVQAVLGALERVAPKRHAFAWDKVGLQVGSPEQPIERALVSLDWSLAAITHAYEAGCQLLLAHHPLIFSPLDHVTSGSHVGRAVRALIKSDISFIAAHTNWDSAKGGVNDTLAEILGLTSVKEFGQGALVENYKLVFFAPEEDVQRVLDAVCSEGAGVIGAYSRCAYMSPGTGTFEGDETTNPTVGEPGRREQVSETRVEVILPADRKSAVERALVKAHSYEEPAYNLMLMTPSLERPAGRLGDLEAPITLGEFVEFVENRLDTKCLAWGDSEKKLKKAAVVGGAADSEWKAAQRAGADVYVTGEVKQHVALEASESGMAILSAGHYQTEQPGVEALAERMRQEAPEVEWRVFSPEKGKAGRPL